MDQVSGSDMGVFVGSFCSDWSKIVLRDPDDIPMYHATGSGQAMLSNRLSYFFNLNGPSLTIDTACSSSLVSLHLACQAIRAGECQSAMVGGVNCLLCHDSLSSMSFMGFLSPDGRSYTYDSRANGYGRGEGVACVMLKPLAQALKDGDTIRAVIRNTGVNQDGKTPGITFPSSKAQAALIRRVYEQAGLNPRDTSYVEAHGTGTQAGDPIEASALFDVFGRDREDAITVGCVKTNIGHLEGASGVAGLVKTVTMLENEAILPNAGFMEPNHKIPLDEWKISVPTTVKSWRASTQSSTLRASINGFGYGGTNAHVILDSARDYLQSRNLAGNTKAANPGVISSGNSDCGPAQSNPSPSDSIPNSPEILPENGTLDIEQDSAYGSLPRGFKLESAIRAFNPTAFEPEPVKNSSANATPGATPKLYVLSAFDDNAGKRLANNLHSYLMDHDQTDVDMEALAFTLGKRRSAFPWKAAVTASSRDELCSALVESKFCQAAKQPTVAFVFTGQGAQWHAMGRELGGFSEFQKSLDLSAEIIQSLGAEWSVAEELSRDAQSTRINEPSRSQPLCTILQIALIDLLRSWNVKPVATVGHSSGEIAAAYAAGIISRQTAVAAAYYRGSATVDGTPGGMAAVSCSEAEAQELVAGVQQGKLVIACYNSPASFTISGDETAIQELLETCASKGVTARKLVVKVAYHSHHMLAGADAYRAALVAAPPSAPEPLEETCDMFSSVTGERIDPADIGPDYWVRNLVSPVKFSDAVATLCLEAKKAKARRTSAKKALVDIVVELGPHRALSGPIRQIFQDNPLLSGVSYVSALTRDKDASQTALSLAAYLFEHGCPLELSSINSPSGNNVAVLAGLPSYSWNHKARYWAEPRESIRYRERKAPRHDLLGAEVKFNNALEPRWRNWVRCSENPWLRDHRVQSLVVYPAAGYICAAVEAARQQALAAGVEIEGYELREVSLGQALIIPESSDTGESAMFTSLRPYAESSKASSAVWSEFFIHSCDGDDNWTEHCRGLISVKPKEAESAGGVRSDEVRAGQQQRNSQARADMLAACSDPVDIPGLYDHCNNIGLEYGPTFANLTRARFCPGKVAGTVVIPDIAACMPAHHHSPFVVHPATLDACLHGIMSFRDTLKAAIMPIFFSKIYIADAISKTAHDELDVFIDIQRSGFRDLNISLMAFEAKDGDAAQPVMSMEGLKMTSLSGAMAKESEVPPPKTYYQQEWRPDPSHLQPSQFIELCAHIRPPGGRRRDPQPLGPSSLLHGRGRHGQGTRRHGTEAGGQEFQAVQATHGTARRCAVGQDALHVSSWTTPHMYSQEGRDAFWKNIGSLGDEGNLAMVIGTGLPGIVRGELDPLEVTMKGDALGRYYANNVRMSRQYAQAAIFVDLLAHRNPHLRVLEIGAGTGGASMPLLRALGKGSSARFTEYMVTDITSGFFDTFRAKTTDWEGLIQFSRLDIERDPAEQGFEEGSYDLVIAANVLHATRNITRTLTNTRKLLKPGGSLLLIELIRKIGGVANMFGIFDGWWMAEEEYRKGSPLLVEDEWDTSLKETGFSGLDSSVWETPDPVSHQGTTMVSTAVVAPTADAAMVHLAPIIVTDGDTTEPALQALATALQQGADAPPKIAGLLQAGLLQTEYTESQCCVFYQTNPDTLGTLTEEAFEHIRALFMKNPSVLWITRGSTDGGASPNFNLISGLMRTLRVELGGSLIHLDLDAKTRLPDEAMAQTVLRVYRQAFVESGGAQDELELAERKGLILTPRYVEATSVCDYVASRTGRLTIESVPVVQPGRALKLEIGQPGLLDSLYFGDDGRVTGELADDQVEIEVKAAALNFIDVMSVSLITWPIVHSFSR